MTEYTLDGNEIPDIAQWLRENADAITVQEAARIQMMRPGEEMLVGGGAGAEFVLRRERPSLCCFECGIEVDDDAGYMRLGGALRRLCETCIDVLDPEDCGEPEDVDSRYDTWAEARGEV